MSDTPSLFDAAADNRKKRPTRFRLDVVDGNGNVVWDVLVTDMPPAEILTGLRSRGLSVRRPVVKGDPDRHLIYSELDPAASIAAAREFMTRRTTKRSEVLRYLLDFPGQWIPRDKIRQIGGDSGDRRVRELRQDGWPIEISQQRDNMPWSCRLNLVGVD